MISALLPLQSFGFCFSAKLPSNSFRFPFLSVPTNSTVISQIHAFSPAKDTHYLKLKLKHKHLTRASPEAVPSDFIEDSKFVPLNSDDLRYGPPALLLLGFEVEETAKIQELLKEIDGEFLKIIHCTEDMITRSLWEAFSTQQPNLEAVKIAKSLPRICILSGLSGEEMVMFIDVFPETGLEPAVFAALVPNSADKPLQEVMEEIMGDHEMVTAQLAGST